MYAREMTWDFQATHCPECKQLVRVRDGKFECKCSKVCPDCKRVFPRTEKYWYVTRRRNAKGKVLENWEPYCRKCKVRRSKERIERRRNDPTTLEADRAYWRAQRQKYVELHPDKAREAQHRHWLKVKNDPEKHEQLLLARRAEYLKLKEFDPEGYRAFRQDERIRQRQESVTKPNPKAPGAYRPGQDRVSLAPFRAWIQETFPGKSVPYVCERLGLEDRVVRNIMDPEYPHQMDLNIIDRALVFFGRPDILNDLYPLREENGHDGNNATSQPAD